MASEKRSSCPQIGEDVLTHHIPINPDIEGATDSKASDTDRIDPHVERRLLWKIDLHVYPILYVVYALSFLDRINISNARIQGLAEDLELHGNRFNVALFVYFIPYILLEIPSNMIIKRVRPSWYLSGLMFSWGIVNMSMGFVKTYAQLVVLRFLLGALEAGVIPGIIYLTSMYYRRHDFQVRMSFFFTSVVVAGAVGGLLAYAIADLDGQLNIRAWRWIFIIEGAVTAFVALIAVFLIVDWPSQARFLSTEEKALLTRILAEDGGDEARMDVLNKQAYKLIFRDFKIWLGSLIYLGVGATGYSLVFFMPTILVEFGWKAREAQVHSIPVYAVTAVVMVLVAWLSDRLRHRYGFILLGCSLATVGYGILLGQDGLSRDVKYGALFFASVGGYIATPMALAWLSNNISGHWKRAFGAGIQVTVGNIVGVVSANVFLEREAPRYHTGYGTALAFNWLGGIAATAMFVGMLLENRKRDAGGRDYRLSRPDEEVRNLGDDHPSFRFTL
ncbi:MFS general substrate transporter [Xylaria bambusicola]|uniref:MFS general substrate transporter n=1 Tax=Xylaria bambusicola TaxID=326684 RepID=UPI002008C181|nr:MFS general substrate transporter [Xylaria bambusicola]KAI0527951.1 MFS general substrate transporter [Xylaria bambusicola]